MRKTEKVAPYMYIKGGDYYVSCGVHYASHDTDLFSRLTRTAARVTNYQKRASEGQKSFMSSTVLHSNLGLTVPSTQNTAPILDFRCLYTHDLRRKAKRWQDGTLRFHTFNKRIMVYDLSKNFIGDYHWCEKHPLQDGDELELDKGVLIQVGESIGTTIQDLSSLFEKRKKAQPEIPGKATPLKPGPASTTRPSPVQLSQLRPKSLNALLGPPKGPLGRASVPSKSPCQFRLENEVVFAEKERSVKRQRVESQSEKAVLPVKLPKKRWAGSDKVATAIKLPSVKAITSDISSIEKRIVEGDRRPITEGTLTIASETLFSVKPRKVTAETGAKSYPTSNGDGSFERDETSNRNAPASSALETSKSSRPKGDQIAVPLFTTTCSKERGRQQMPDTERVNQLQIIARKPRRKLLYKDLLPQSANSAKPSSDEPGSERKSIEADRRGTRPDTRVKHHQAEHDRLKARLQKIDEKEEKQLGATGNLDRLCPDDWGSDIFMSTPSLLEQTTNKPPDTSQLHSKTSTEYETKLLKHTLSNQNHSRTFNRPTSPPISLPSMIAEPTILIPNSPPQLIRPLKPANTFASNRLSLPRMHSTTTAPVPVLVQDQKPDPWSREAWDIFGHGRPEKKTGY